MINSFIIKYIKKTHNVIQTEDFYQLETLHITKPLTSHMTKTSEMDVTIRVMFGGGSPTVKKHSIITSQTIILYNLLNDNVEYSIEDGRLLPIVDIA